MITRKELIKAAEDINDIFGETVDEKIDITANSEDLKTLIKKAVLWLWIDDEPSEETVEVIRSLQWTPQDFEDLKEDQDPMPVLMKMGITPPGTPFPEAVEATKSKPVKPKKPTKLKKPVKKVEAVSEEPLPEEPPKEFKEAPPKKAKKAAEPPPASAYSTAFSVMGTDPNMPIHELYDRMKKLGFNLQSTGNSIKTARSTFRRCYYILKENGFAK